MPPVAVIDIGSNTIKLLVAARDEAGRVQALATRTIEARISAGIGRDHPYLAEAGIANGVAAIRELVTLAQHHAPTRIELVATSAVRDASNGAEFVARVLDATGQRIRVLNGDEEADFIGRGLTTDPELAHLRDFHVFDLGGGSLECLAFHDRKIHQAFSARLGCVRLTEQFITNPAAPLLPAEETALAAHVRTVLTDRGFAPQPGATAVFAGGSMTTVRALLGASQGRPIGDTPQTIPVTTLEGFLAELRPLDLAARRVFPGLPASRADVFPAALVTMIAVAKLGGFTGYQHSFYNLRWGLAAVLLEA